MSLLATSAPKRFVMCDNFRIGSGTASARAESGQGKAVSCVKDEKKTPRHGVSFSSFARLLGRRLGLIVVHLHGELAVEDVLFFRPHLRDDIGGGLPLSRAHRGEPRAPLLDHLVSGAIPRDETDVPWPPA